MTTGRRRTLAALGWLSAAAACHSLPPTPAWHEMFLGRALGQFVVTDFGGQGEVAVHDGRLHLGQGSPLTGVTWLGPLPPPEYQLEVTAARHSGNDFFCGLTFPVGAAHLTLVLGGWGGSVCGLSSLDGMDAAHNATRTLRHFDTDRDYTILVTVTADRVDVALDGQPLLGTERTGHQCSLRPEVALSQPLGFASFATAASLRSLRWRRLGNDLDLHN